MSSDAFSGDLSLALEATALAAEPMLDLVAERTDSRDAPTVAAAQRIFAVVRADGVAATFSRVARVDDVFAQTLSESVRWVSLAARHAIKAASLARSAAEPGFGEDETKVRTSEFWSFLGATHGALMHALDAIGVAHSSEVFFATYLDARTSIVRARKAEK